MTVVEILGKVFATDASWETESYTIFVLRLRQFSGTNHGLRASTGQVHFFAVTDYVNQPPTLFRLA